MNKTKTLIAGVFTATAIAIGVTTVVLINQKPSAVPPKQAATTQVQQVHVKDNQLSFTADKGKNVLDQLKARTTVVTQDSSYGPYVTTIDGIAQGGGKYWTLYVNDAMSDKGAADYVTNGGEKITWKLE